MLLMGILRTGNLLHPKQCAVARHPGMCRATARLVAQTNRFPCSSTSVCVARGLSITPNVQVAGSDFHTRSQAGAVNRASACCTFSAWAGAAVDSPR